jgi:pilus assembly protein CpaB
MAQSITAASAGRVNRRFLFLALVLAALSAVLIYPLLTRSSDSGGAVAGVPVVVAKITINPGTTITSDMLEVQQVPQAAIGAQAFSDVESAVGEVVRYPLVPGEQVLVSKIVGRGVSASPEVLSNFIESGLRGMAINTELVVGAGGLVLPGDYVDVFWVPENSPDDVPGAQLVAEDVEVMSVDQTIVDIPPTAPGLLEEGEEPPTGSDTRIRGSEAEPIPAAVTVTLMLSITEIQTVFCAEETGELRLAVRAFGDHSPAGIPPVSCVVVGTEN